jgi:ABC-2 type transport system permease protein
LKTFMAFLKSSFKQFSRDKMALFMTFAFPLIFMLIFGLIYSGDNNFKASIGLAAADDTPVARAITQAFQAIPAFTTTSGSLEGLTAQLKQGKLSAVVDIPAGIDASLANGQIAAVELYYDPSDASASQVILPIVKQVIDQTDRQVSRQPELIQVQAQSIQSHQMRNLDYLVPGIVAMSILSTGLFCAVPLIQQREKKILKR